MRSWSVASPDARAPLGAPLKVPAWLRAHDNRVTLNVVARPGAGRRGLLRLGVRGPVVALLSAPERGKANRELAEFFARASGVSISAVAITRGRSGPNKTVTIATSKPLLATERLLNALGVRPS